MTELATQLKAQNDKAISLPDDQQSRLEAEFAKAGIMQPSGAPIVTPAAPVVPAAPAAPAAPAPAPKGKVPEALLKKPAVAKADPAATDDFTAPEGLKAESSARFQKLVSRAKAAEEWRAQHEPKLKEYEPKLKTYEEELTKLRSAPPAALGNDEVEKLKKERDTLDGLLKQTAIEKHPQFKAAYDDKITERIARAQAIVGTEHAGALSLILDQPDTKAASEAYEQLADAIGSFKANQLLMVTQSLRDLRSERGRELENWKTNAEHVATAEKSKALEAETLRAGELESHIKKTIDSVTAEDSELFVFKRIQGEDEWNKGVKGRLDELNRISRKSLTAADQVELAKRAVAADGAYEALAQILPQFQALQAELDAIKASTPGFGGSGASGVIPEPKNETYADNVERKLREAGVFAR